MNGRLPPITWRASRTPLVRRPRPACSWPPSPSARPSFASDARLPARPLSSAQADRRDLHAGRHERRPARARRRPRRPRPTKRRSSASMPRRPERFDETLEIVLKGWGRAPRPCRQVLHLNDIPMVMQPVQRPHRAVARHPLAGERRSPGRARLQRGARHADARRRPVHQTLPRRWAALGARPPTCRSSATRATWWCWTATPTPSRPPVAPSMLVRLDGPSVAGQRRRAAARSPRRLRRDGRTGYIVAGSPARCATHAADQLVSASTTASAASPAGPVVRGIGAVGSPVRARGDAGARAKDDKGRARRTGTLPAAALAGRRGPFGSGFLFR